MTSRAITKKQFVGWLIVFTIGMVLWASPAEPLWRIAIGIVVIGNLILLGPRERSRSLSLREVLSVFGILLLFAVFILVSKQWVPNDLSAPFAGFVRHPAFVVPLWAFVVWLTYRRYKLTKTNAPHAA